MEKLGSHTVRYSLTSAWLASSRDVASTLHIYGNTNFSKYWNQNGIGSLSDCFPPQRKVVARD